jgi:hypothetical protein
MTPDAPRAQAIAPPGPEMTTPQSEAPKPIGQLEPDAAEAPGKGATGR